MGCFFGGLTPTFNSIIFENVTQERILAWASFCFDLLFVDMPYGKNSHGVPEYITNQLHWTTLSCSITMGETFFWESISLGHSQTHTHTTEN